MLLACLLLALSSCRSIAAARRFTTLEYDRRSDCGDTFYIPGAAKQRRGSQPQPHRLNVIHSRCTGETTYGDRLLVTTAFGYDATWLRELPIPKLIYAAGDSSAEYSHVNFGNEAMGYLTFIAENYECLPEVVAFAHPHREAWHSSHSLDYNLERVRWDAVPGFAVMHRKGLWWEQYVADPGLNLRGKENATKSTTAPCHQILNDTAYNGDALDHFWRGEWISHSWRSFFGPAGLGEVPDVIRCSVSAEFYVTRDRIRLRPHQFYLKTISWMLSNQRAGPLTSYQVGCVLENLWHIIFGEQPHMSALTIQEDDLYDNV